MAQVIRTRFAPSPTGYLHLGNARTALFNALLARHHRGTFVLRIEDTDPQRSRKEFALALQEDLEWLGLTWDEGPVIGGENSPYQQSKRLAIYEKYFDDLLRNSHVYPCFCTIAELERQRRLQLGRGKAPRYAGTCAHLADQARRARLDRGEPYALRFRVPSGESVEFDDLVRGPQVFASDDIGDFIIRRIDGSAAFFFSNALDDALMAVTHVLRGEDHLANTPRQILLLRALGLTVPAYGHLALILTAKGSPLSKREGSASLRDLRAQGFLPGALINYLSRLGYSGYQSGYMAIEGLAVQFDLVRLGRAPAQFDSAQLHYWQRETIAHEAPARLLEWMGAEARTRVPQTHVDAFVEIVRSNVTFPDDALQWADILFGESAPLEPDAEEVVLQAGSEFFEQVLEVLAHNADDFGRLVAGIKAATGRKGKALFLPLRAALTGRLDGPELGALVALMSARTVHQRLETCARRAAGR